MALIERQEELSCLETLIAGAALGEGRIALVSGPPAMGKSALLDALAERAIDVGALAITATASRMEQGLQLGVLRQLIQDAPLVRGERERAARLIEEGRRSATERAGSELLLEEQVVHALITVLLEQSERYPLVILVDDVHHADRASLICLAYMARRVRARRPWRCSRATTASRTTTCSAPTCCACRTAAGCACRRCRAAAWPR
ncbi:ATP-binding protein [Nonomuraea rubra]|uniref:ATP-binding protein n=1 Tax=Nonomuraea rubra TaxID=46180 RepID=UPI003617435A